MEDRYEIDTNIGEELSLFDPNINDPDKMKCNKEKFLKFSQKKQIEILLNSLNVFITLLNDDLKDIWKRMDKI